MSSANLPIARPRLAVPDHAHALELANGWYSSDVEYPPTGELARAYVAHVPVAAPKTLGEAAAMDLRVKHLLVNWAVATADGGGR